MEAKILGLNLRTSDECEMYRKHRRIITKREQLEIGRAEGMNSSQGGAESLHLLFSVWNHCYTYPLSLKGAPLSTPLKSLGTNATPEYYPN